MVLVTDNEHPDGRVVGLYIGTVVDNRDPDGAGKVRVRIAAVCEPSSAWAPPLGTLGGGSQRRGGFFVPEIGAEVGVLFHQGDVDYPYYVCGHWGWKVKDDGSDAPVEGDVNDQWTTTDNTETPSPVKGLSPEERPLVQAIETSKFIIVIDNRPGEEEAPLDGKERLLLLYRDDPENYIEIDGLNRGVTISGTSGVNIRSSGVVNIEGTQVQINGRRVNDLKAGDI